VSITVIPLAVELVLEKVTDWPECEVSDKRGLKDDVIRRKTRREM